jgi:hypothetical protein
MTMSAMAMGTSALRVSRPIARVGAKGKT